jgi:hypothetical protein
LVGRIRSARGLGAFWSRPAEENRSLMVLASLGAHGERCREEPSAFQGFRWKASGRSSTFSDE